MPALFIFIVFCDIIEMKLKFKKVQPQVSKSSAKLRFLYLYKDEE